jgi:hypothetical protein
MSLLQSVIKKIFQAFICQNKETNVKKYDFWKSFCLLDSDESRTKDPEINLSLNLALPQLQTKKNSRDPGIPAVMHELDVIASRSGWCQPGLSQAPMMPPSSRVITKVAERGYG